MGLELGGHAYREARFGCLRIPNPLKFIQKSPLLTPPETCTFLSVFPIESESHPTQPPYLSVLAVQRITTLSSALSALKARMWARIVSTWGGGVGRHTHESQVLVGSDPATLSITLVIGYSFAPEDRPARPCCP